MLNPSDPAPSSARRRWRASRRARIRCDEKFFSTTSGGSTSAGAGAGVPDGSVSDGTRPAGAGAAEAATPVADAPPPTTTARGASALEGRRRTRRPSHHAQSLAACAASRAPPQRRPACHYHRAPRHASLRCGGEAPQLGMVRPVRRLEHRARLLKCERCRLHLSLFLVRGPELLQVGGEKRPPRPTRPSRPNMPTWWRGAQSAPGQAQG